jgi:hypothetical protein
MIRPYGLCSSSMSFSLQSLDSLLKGEFLGEQCFFGLHGTSGRKLLFENKQHSLDSLYDFSALAKKRRNLGTAQRSAELV